MKKRRNYPKLMGREVQVQMDCSLVTGVITGADWSIGLTIQEKDTNKYLLCFNGPKSPLMRDNHTFDHQAHRVAMAYVHDCIVAKRTLSFESLRQVMCVQAGAFLKSGFVSASSCPFSQ